VFTFYLGGFYESGQADPDAFSTTSIPGFYLFLVPAVAMRLWGRKRTIRDQSNCYVMSVRSPAPEQWVLGKFLAAWGVYPGAPWRSAAGAFPIIITGPLSRVSPDQSAIFYRAGSWLLAGRLG